MKKIVVLLFIAIVFIVLVFLTDCPLNSNSSYWSSNSGGGGNSSNNKTPIIYTTNYNSNTVTYFNATTGAYINGNLTNSSFTTGIYPTDVIVNQ